MYSQVAPPDNISECSPQNDANVASENLLGEDSQSCKDESLLEKPAGVSAEKWQKFQKLKERRQEMCKPLPAKVRGKHGRKRVGDGSQLFTDDASCSSQTVKKSKGEILKANKKAWKELCSNIDANIHLSQDSIGRQKPKSKLEEKLDKAVKEGNFSKAEELSDELSRQELGVKIADAIEMREYKKKNEVEEKWKKSKKKKKLLWGFEQKERWESKGNM